MFAIRPDMNDLSIFDFCKQPAQSLTDPAICRMRPVFTDPECHPAPRTTASLVAAIKRELREKQNHKEAFCLFVTSNGRHLKMT